MTEPRNPFDPDRETREQREARELAEYVAEHPDHARAIADRAATQLATLGERLVRSRALIDGLLIDLRAIERFEGPIWPPTIEDWIDGDTEGAYRGHSVSARTAQALRDHLPALEHLRDVLAAYLPAVTEAEATLEHVRSELDEAGGDASPPAV